MIPPASPETHARWAGYRAALVGMRRHVLRGMRFCPEDVVSAALLCVGNGDLVESENMFEAMQGYDLFFQFGDPRNPQGKLRPYVLDFMKLCKKIDRNHKHQNLDASYLLGLTWTPTPRGPFLFYQAQIGFPVHEEGW